MSTTAEVLAPHQTLVLNTRKGRFGVAYVRTIAGQAGCSFRETSPDEDVMAVDCTVDFPEGDARVQVKATKKYKISGSDEFITYYAEESWMEKWARTAVPLYFIVVVVPDTSPEWLEHADHGTLLVRTAAYWVRLQPDQFKSSNKILVPRAQRLTEATFVEWHSDLCALYGFETTGSDEAA